MKILIVEDVFIEAEHLGLILTKAGHTITAVVKSVDHAFNALKKERPDIAMLDIFLQGELTGVHLSRRLAKDYIPFIYLSANSNPSILHAAKETKPYGFLVKPFRESDILMALDIAEYRHRQAMDHFARQQDFIGTILNSIINTVGTPDQKLVFLVKGLQQVIPFDHLLVNMDQWAPGPGSWYCFQRVGLDDYRRVNFETVFDKHCHDRSSVRMRRKNDDAEDVRLRNGRDFLNSCIRDPVIEIMRKRYKAQSSITVSASGPGGENSELIFFSHSEHGFTAEHAELIKQLRGLITVTINNIRLGETSSNLVFPASRVKAANETWMNGIVGKSQALLQVMDMVRQVAHTQSTVLILGETGVGKEGIAAAIHRCSNRKDEPFVKINCAAIPSLLVESELFGHEKGAFTDAGERRIGKFEQAEGGTIFLDEIGELPLAAQAKILRALQEKEIERVGGFSPVKLDVRIIAATNRDLYAEVSNGRFRMDLYYRINVFPIEIPPLRDRKDDIPLLAEHFLHRLSMTSGKAAKVLSAAALKQLMQYAWPGNIRELQHLLERHVVTSKTDTIEQIILPQEPNVSPAGHTASPSIKESERDEILSALGKSKGRVSGKGGAAELIGVNPNTLSSRMRRLGIRRNFNT